MTVVVVTPPADPVVSLDDAKAHLRVDHDDDDALIEGLVAAATEHLDGPAGWLGRALGRQTLEISAAGFPLWPVRLPYAPVVSVTSVKYDDSSGVEQTVDPSVYVLSPGGDLAPAYGARWPAVRPGASAARIRYLAGYDAGKLPAPIRAAILLMVGDLYANRETVAAPAPGTVPMSVTVDRLLSPFRMWRV